MILSEYEAKRAAEHKMELHIKYLAECKKIQSQIGNLKKRQKEALKQYQNDKAWFHAKYREEKQQITSPHARAAHGISHCKRNRL